MIVSLIRIRCLEQRGQSIPGRRSNRDAQHSAIAALILMFIITLSTCDERDGFPDDLIGTWAYQFEYQIQDCDTTVLTLNSWGIDSAHLSFFEDYYLTNVVYRPAGVFRDSGTWTFTGNTLNMDFEQSGSIREQMELVEDSLILRQGSLSDCSGYSITHYYTRYD